MTPLVEVPSAPPILSAFVLIALSAGLVGFIFGALCAAAVLS